MWLKDYIPALRYGAKIRPEEFISNGLDVFASIAENVWYVDGDNGADTNSGTTPDNAFSTIQAGINAAAADGGIVFIKARDMAAGATDPVSYAETLTIPAGSSRMALIGVSGNRTQGGLPQIKKGSGSTALLTVRAPGCLIANLGFNGMGSTGGGILLDDDASTKSAFGTAIIGCHFKNCVGSTATNAATGGAIQWPTAGGAWQVLIKGNRFYKNVGDIVMKGTTGSVPQDVVIEDNIFSDPAANVDCNIYVAADGIVGLVIRNNVFPEVPNISSGTNKKYIILGAGTTGIIANNYFGTDKTFGASGNGATIPTTVFLSGNYDEGGLIARA